jgi:hypothetical protein
MEMRQIFYDEPIVRLHDNGNIEYYKKWSVRLNGYLSEVEAKFISDGNSVPKLLRWLVPQYGNITNMGGWHDWAYYFGKVWDVRQGKWVNLTRKQADQFALAIGKKCQVSWRVRMRWYIGVRLGGGGTWKGYRLMQRICN